MNRASGRAVGWADLLVGHQAIGNVQAKLIRKFLTIEVVDRTGVLGLRRKANRDYGWPAKLAAESDASVM
jgi:hypothetical protein